MIDQAGKHYGILFSHASENTIPGLVYGEYSSRMPAVDDAMRTARGGGVKFLIVTRKHEGPWLTRSKQTPIEAIRAAMTSGFKGWQP